LEGQSISLDRLTELPTPLQREATLKMRVRHGAWCLTGAGPGITGLFAARLHRRLRLLLERQDGRRR
jgi:hypothetical protein